MDKYENLGLVGEGSYGLVMKCRHKETQQLVAVKKFLETDEDKMVKKIAMREVRMLKQLRHENLVNLIEVFRRKKRLYLVFEFVDRTALDDLNKYPMGADEGYVKKVMWQVLKGVEFCHSRNIIHRDVKPENILISKRGVVKLCDFGFARTLAPPGEAYTDYVATRWYRAPELLVGDTNYGRAVDIWAIGCLFLEMLTGEPLFPGESDIDQLYMITKCFGHLIARHREIFSRNPLFIGMRLPEARELEPMERRFPRLSAAALDNIKWSLRLDPNDRPTCSQLLRHELFTKGSWADKFTVDLRNKVERELDDNPLLKHLGITIHGSLYEHRMEEQRKAAAMLDVPSATNYMSGGMTSGNEGFTSGMEDTIVKERKKKRTKKSELLHGRQKALPDRIGDPQPKKHVAKKPHHLEKMDNLISQSSHTSLNASQTRLNGIAPRSPNMMTQLTGNLSPLPPRQEQALAPAPLMTHHAHTTAHLLTTQQLPSYRHLSPAPPPAPHTHPHQPHNPISNPNPPLSRRNSVKSHISFASPPTSMIDEPLTINLQRNPLLQSVLSPSTIHQNSAKHNNTFFSNTLKPLGVSMTDKELLELPVLSKHTEAHSPMINPQRRLGFDLGEVIGSQTSLSSGSRGYLLKAIPVQQLKNPVRPMQPHGFSTHAQTTAAEKGHHSHSHAHTSFPLI